MLGKFALRQPQDTQVRAEHDGAAGGGALIERQDRAGLGHLPLPATVWRGLVAMHRRLPP